MDTLTEVKIEYRRLLRHVNYLEKRYSPAVARDLSACLRVWTELKEEIDNLAKLENWELKFNYAVTSKKLRQMSIDSDEFSLPLPGGARDSGAEVKTFKMYNRALNDKEIRLLYEQEKNNMTNRKVMKFSQWLDHRAFQLKTPDGNIQFSRNEVIEGVANLLGGSHPASVRKEVRQSDRYIKELMNNSILNWPMPYAILMESAQEIINVFKKKLAK